MKKWNKRKTVLQATGIALVALIVFSIGAPGERSHYPYLTSNNLVVINPDTGAVEYTRKDLQNEQVGHYVLSGPNNSPNVSYNVNTNESNLHYYSDAYPTTPEVVGADEETLWPIGYGGLLYDSYSDTIVDGRGLIDARTDGSYRYLAPPSSGGSIDWLDQVLAEYFGQQRELLYTGPDYVYSPFLTRTDIGWPRSEPNDTRGSSGYEKNDIRVFLDYPELQTQMGQALAAWGLPTRLEYDLPWWGITRPGAAAALADYHGRDPRKAEYQNAINGSLTTVAIVTSVSPVGLGLKGMIKGAPRELIGRKVLQETGAELGLEGLSHIDPWLGMIGNVTAGSRGVHRLRTPALQVHGNGASAWDMSCVPRAIENVMDPKREVDVMEELFDAEIFDEMTGTGPGWAKWAENRFGVTLRPVEYPDEKSFVDGVDQVLRRGDERGFIGYADHLEGFSGNTLHTNHPVSFRAFNGGYSPIRHIQKFNRSKLKVQGLSSGYTIYHVVGTPSVPIPVPLPTRRQLFRQGLREGAERWGRAAAVSNGILQAFRAHSSLATQQGGTSTENSILGATAPTSISAHVFANETLNRGRLLSNTQGKQVQACE